MKACPTILITSPFIIDYIPPLQGSSVLASFPRTLPWAGISRPFWAITSVVLSLTARRKILQACAREAGNPHPVKNQSQPPRRI